MNTKQTIEEIEYLKAVIPNMPLSEEAIKNIMQEINKLDNKIKQNYTPNDEVQKKSGRS